MSDRETTPEANPEALVEGQRVTRAEDMESSAGNGLLASDSSDKRDTGDNALRGNDTVEE